jgi:hypothetical protein
LFNIKEEKILTTGIHSVFRGLKVESDDEIGQKEMFFKALASGKGVFPVRALSLKIKGKLAIRPPREREAAVRNQNLAAGSKSRKYPKR